MNVNEAKLWATFTHVRELKISKNMSQIHELNWTERKWTAFSFIFFHLCRRPLDCVTIYPRSISPAITNNSKNRKMVQLIKNCWIIAQWQIFESSEWQHLEKLEKERVGKYNIIFLKSRPKSLFGFKIISANTSWNNNFFSWDFRASWSIRWS